MTCHTVLPPSLGAGRWFHSRACRRCYLAFIRSYVIPHLVHEPSFNPCPVPIIYDTCREVLRRSVTMSTSAIDSLQNALVDTISGVYLKRVRLIWVRLLVLALTVPCMIVSLKVCLPFVKYASFQVLILAADPLTHSSQYALCPKMKHV